MLAAWTRKSYSDVVDVLKLTYVIFSSQWAVANADTGVRFTCVGFY
jgi:hypothetical protein